MIRMFSVWQATPVVLVPSEETSSSAAPTIEVASGPGMCGTVNRTLTESLGSPRPQQLPCVSYVGWAHTLYSDRNYFYGNPRNSDQWLGILHMPDKEWLLRSCLSWSSQQSCEVGVTSFLGGTKQRVSHVSRPPSQQVLKLEFKPSAAWLQGSASAPKIWLCQKGKNEPPPHQKKGKLKVVRILLCFCLFSFKCPAEES